MATTNFPKERIGGAGLLLTGYLDASITGGLRQRLVITLGLIRIGKGETGYTLIQGRTSANIAGEQRRVTQLGVRQGQRPAAEHAVGREIGDLHLAWVELESPLHVA